ncbi:MAG: M20 family metallopeptidase [candidate division Zixibacteria bacterium]|nr:M20 family metallopeptidase [candidate division Zixibacteria bacterium]
MPIEKNEILKLTEKLYLSQVKWRRHLHQYPELSNQEFKTTAFLKKQLTHYGIGLYPLKMKTGAVGIIRGHGKSVAAVRSDIDALPITEINRLPFRSKEDGVMHACGHDIHMAVVLGTAIILQWLKKKLPGTIKILFQPSEEMPPGGAAEMIREGILKNPSPQMIFGVHVDPTVTTGKIGLRDGAIMASVTDFDITIFGRGGHAARPHLGVDAIVTAAELIDSMQKIVSREINPLKPVVITFGSISGGTARNVIADKVTLHGTARTLSRDSLKRIPNLIKRTIDGVCRARGADYKLDFIANYPPLCNNENANKILAEAYQELFGKNQIVESPQGMGGEDFAFYVQKVPGAMFRLGVKNDKIGANKPWHASDFIADERSLFYGTALLTMSVVRFLEKQEE